MAINVPQWTEVRSEPMTKPNHPQRWFEQMLETWSKQQDKLIVSPRTDGTSKATPNGLVWDGASITSTEIMPFCIVGKRMYAIGLNNRNAYHVSIGDSSYVLKPNVPLELGSHSLLVLSEKVARVAFPIHGRMVYGHRIGSLYADIDGNIWEEVWRNAKEVHEVKDMHRRTHNDKTTHRIDTYQMKCNLGNTSAQMLYNLPAEEKREVWKFDVSPLPYTPKEDDALQVHFTYVEISFEGAQIQIVNDGNVVAESKSDSKPLYVPIVKLPKGSNYMYITPHTDGRIDMKNVRLVECVHELVE